MRKKNYLSLAALHRRLELAFGALILRAHRLRLGAHARDFLGGQAAAVVLQLHLRVRARLAVARRDGEQAVGVHLKLHVNLGLALLSALDAGDLELTEKVVAVRVRALALEDAHVDLVLVVVNSGELLLLLARHGGVARHNLGEGLALHLDAERERDDVHQKQVCGRRVADARQNRALHGGAVRHRFIRVHGLVQNLAVEVLRQERLDARHARGAADEHDFVDVRLLHLGVVQNALDGFEAPQEQRFANLLEPRARVRHVDLVVADERLDGGAGGGRQHALRAFASRS
mmetsp:Transcript_7028/g.28958  ORF Transcript_7028/g.28958 Transcript_7028/m.28958 type:complete len:288 (+) Transcript_7028:1463-2326(+)